MEKKKKESTRHKERYFKHYEVVKTLKPDGVGIKKDLVYVGDYYKLQTPAKHMDNPARYRRSIRIIYALFMTVFAILFVAMGMIDSGVNTAFYVLLPYVIMIWPVTFIVVYGVEFIAQKRDLEQPVYDRCVGKMRSYTIFLAVLGGLSTVGEIVFLFIARRGTLWQEILFAVLAAIVFILSLYFIYIQKKVTYDIIPARSHTIVEECEDSTLQD